MRRVYEAPAPRLPKDLPEALRVLRTPPRRAMFSLDDLTPDDQSRIRTDIQFATAGGVAAAALLAAGLVAVGVASDGETRALVDAATPSVRFLASAVMTVSATTLALMLTLLGLSTDIDGDVKKGHFERVRQIALVDTAAFVIATVLLVAAVVPADPSSPVPADWFGWIYYAVSVVISVVAGGLIAVMLLLFAAIRDMIVVLAPGDDNPLIDDDDVEEEVEEAEDEVEEAEEAVDEVQDAVEES